MTTHLTHFSSSTWMKEIQEQQIQDVSHTLKYFMWHTKAEENKPTQDDVTIWILVLMSRDDYDSEEVQSLIQSCRDYNQTFNSQ